MNKKLFIFLLTLKLFYFEIMIAHYTPSIIFIRSAPTLLLIICFLTEILSKKIVEKNSYLLIFIILLCVSSINAENLGRSKIAIRLIFEYYILSLLAFSIIKSENDLKLILRLYILSIVYLGCWGIYGFLKSGRGIIIWDYILNNEDAFGPYMCIGFVVSLNLIKQGKNYSVLCFMGCLFGIVGVIISFARGAFLVFAICCLISFLNKRNLIKSMTFLIITALFTITISGFFFKNNEFWEEMSTITEGTAEGTGRDRKVLWSIAWEEFKDNPIFGVGPYNFGVVAPKYLEKVEDKRSYTKETIWGRALHNGFFQILCETGIIGSILFITMLVQSWKNNRKAIYRINENKSKFVGFEMIASRAIFKGILAFFMNAFFYDIIFYDWLFKLLIYYGLITLYINYGSSGKCRGSR